MRLGAQKPATVDLPTGRGRLWTIWFGTVRAKYTPRVTRSNTAARARPRFNPSPARTCESLPPSFSGDTGHSVPGTGGEQSRLSRLLSTKRSPAGAKRSSSMGLFRPWRNGRSGRTSGATREANAEVRVPPETGQPLDPMIARVSALTFTPPALDTTTTITY